MLVAWNNKRGEKTFTVLLAISIRKKVSHILKADEEKKVKSQRAKKNETKEVGSVNIFQYVYK